MRSFQDAHGLAPTGVCDEVTWNTLVEAGWSLGDRLLFHAVPLLRGEDVAELQRRLGRLGFDAGRVDGMYGVSTTRALQEFQRNVGLTPDGVCGYATLEALRRLGDRGGDGPLVAAVREREALRAAPPTLAGRRIVVGDLGGLSPLTRAVTRKLRAAGASVFPVEGTDGSSHAQAANRVDAHAYLGILGTAEAGRITYYAVEGFESLGGRRLAELLLEGLTRPHLALPLTVKGLRQPVLRETRMPAVCCELGPVVVVRDQLPLVAATIASAVAHWAAVPLT